MVDSISKDRRSEIMRRIPTKNSRPELFVKDALRKAGFRYSTNKRTGLLRSPDILFVKLGVAVFVHGCFWHGHNCHLGRTPKSNRNFWLAKVSTNQRRDARVAAALRKRGWVVRNVWECSLPLGTQRLLKTLEERREMLKSGAIFTKTV